MHILTKIGYAVILLGLAIYAYEAIPDIINGQDKSGPYIKRSAGAHALITIIGTLFTTFSGLFLIIGSVLIKVGEKKDIVISETRGKSFIANFLIIGGIFLIVILIALFIMIIMNPPSV